MGLYGMNAYPVAAEINTDRGIPAFDIVGLGDQAVMESRKRVKSALQNCGVALRNMSIVVNLAPASVKKTGSLYDLTILTALLAANGMIRIDAEQSAFVGEVSLGGDVVGINGALTLAIAAFKNGIKEIFLPADNAKEASVVEGLTVYGVRNIGELIRHLKGERRLTAQEPFIPEETDYGNLPDFADVKGQETAKEAMITAAAGFHNVLMIGPPGAGKSMLAKCLPSILPKMSFEESIETTQIHSIAGMIDPKKPLITQRPFRPVLHTASAVGLIGGGGIPKPGEISLAHNGVLFLDELPEFERRTLETLRQPLEEGVVNITRASGKTVYPCNIMMVAAMNPCPCGNFGHPTKPCTCNAKAAANYVGRISQPLLDRIDIHIEMKPIKYEEISGAKSKRDSTQIRDVVEQARFIQAERFKGTNIRVNSRIPPGLLQEICVMEPDAAQRVKDAFEKLGLSARAYDKILKVSRTVADLRGSKIITRAHVSLAIALRSLDRKYWQR
jgi:magnesium chelatase family protein